LIDNCLPSQRPQRRLRDKNKNGGGQPKILNFVETLTKRNEIHPSERKIQQESGDGRFQQKTKEASH